MEGNSEFMEPFAGGVDVWDCDADVSSFMTNPQPQETKDYIMQQTMMRVKDPVKSLEFYCNVLGFRLIHYSEVREMAHGTAIEYCV